MSRWRTAIHEAGHGVVAMGYGLPLSTVTIVPTADALGQVVPDGSSADRSAPPLTAEQRVEVRLLDATMRIAGQIAEELMFGAAERDGCSDDDHQSAIAVGSVEDMTGAVAFQFRNAIRDVTLLHLKENWDQVLRLAAALVDEGCLSGARARAVVGPVTELDLSRVEGAVTFWARRNAARMAKVN